MLGDEYVASQSEARRIVYPIPLPTATVRLEAATEKQVAYAQDIATRLNISVPADVLASKALMIRWIDDHKKKKA